MANIFLASIASGKAIATEKSTVIFVYGWTENQSGSGINYSNEI
ncbi:MAG: hypothetical protein P5694_18910 [Limnospira sp. PMC 1286.21]|nr:MULTISPECIES: hypothetical protein [unclassified Limnospira]MDT9194958.1 hypothetical protein [Limnospira sp. PMC 1245.20]MDT9206929.1 hypothetical protein [Limnospira sp. PMC 1252.20]MDT9220390.1 hypothetical protein [Limnospira sp. PMC 1240.20]MDT9256292.1 hypothetical protein [Limnospira sp. PMC 1254.20]MDT9261412.1 hypothetical protein [Limnospira sp. PMC 1236.20]